MILCASATEGLAALQSGVFDCCVTSPPYWGLRDYGTPWQIGLERTPEEYVARLVEAFREVRRVLRDDGTLWLNLGDCYASNGGHTDTACNDRRGAYNLGNRPEHNYRAFRQGGGALKSKDLVGIPWMVAFALRADGWWLRSEIIWHKPNPMPESVRDRPTTAHEKLFLLSKRARYYYDAKAVAEKSTGQKGIAANFARASKEHVGPRQSHAQHRLDREPTSDNGKRNLRSVWTVAPQPFRGAHFAVFPEKLIEPCILAGSRLGGLVLDPFGGSGTTERVAQRLGRKSVLIDINPAYCALAAG